MLVAGLAALPRLEPNGYASIAEVFFGRLNGVGTEVEDGGSEDGGTHGAMTVGSKGADDTVRHRQPRASAASISVDVRRTPMRDVLALPLGPLARIGAIPSCPSSPMKGSSRTRWGRMQSWCGSLEIRSGAISNGCH